MSLRLPAAGPAWLPDFAASILARINEARRSPRYTVATLPLASANTGLIVFVSDDSGGATIAFSDGTDWRRAQDRTIVS